MPPKIATPRMARGMSLLGLRASSPSVADASKPANDKNPNTTPRNRADVDAPGSGLNTDQVNVDPPGAEGDSSLASPTTGTIRISVTVHTSTISSTLVPPRAGSAASISASTSATPTDRIGAQDGWFFQAPSESSSWAANMPAAPAVVTA